MSKSVTIYSTQTCPWCTTAKNYLDEKGIQYTDKDVSSDQSAAQEMIAKSGQMGVPQILINDEIVVGFDQARIDSLLEL